VNSRKAAPEVGYNASALQTDRFIVVTLVLVTIVAEQGSTIVNVKLNGATRLAEE